LTNFSQTEGIDPTSVNYAIVDQSLTKSAGGTRRGLPLLLMGILLFYSPCTNPWRSNIFSFGEVKRNFLAKANKTSRLPMCRINDAKKMEEIVDFLKTPGKYRKMGARTPKGVLLFGQLELGNLLARAVAGEAGVRFFSMAGANLWKCFRLVQSSERFVCSGIKSLHLQLFLLMKLTHRKATWRGVMGVMMKESKH